MPIKPENKARYPKEWKAIRARILKRAGDCCEWCHVPDTALQRFAAMGYLECVHYNVLPAAQEAIDAARSQAKEGA